MHLSNLDTIFTCPPGVFEQLGIEKEQHEGLVEFHSLLVHLLKVLLLHGKDEVLLDIIRDSNLVKIK